MNEASDNPYRPPAVQDPAAPSDGAWQVSGRDLLFRDGARLPPVDLFTGEAGGDLVPCSQQFKSTAGVKARRLLVLVLVTAGATFAFAISDWRLGPGGFALFFVAMMILARIFVPNRIATARLHWFTRAGGENRRQGKRTIATVFYLLSLFALFGTIALEHPSMPALLGAIMALSVSSFFHQRVSRLRSGDSRDGWFVLHGIHPEALRELSGRQPTIATAFPEKRLRKVHAVYLYRFPFSLLIAHQWWNPFLIAMIAVMKLTRSPHLVRDQFAPTEAESIREEDCDPDLREMAAAVRREPDFASWTPALASRLDTPAGDHRTDCLVLLSPDRVHSLTLALARFASAQISRRVPERTFRTWLDDGTVLLTTDAAMLRPFPTAVKTRRIRLPLRGLYSAHIARLEGASPQPLADYGDLLARLRREGEERRAVLESAGLYGPLREEEFPVLPAAGKFPQ